MVPALTALGVLVGCLVVASDHRHPGDLGGYILAGAMGGCAGFALAVVVLALA